ncbi:MAG: LuxR family transcriptional regulator [Smithella sp. SDB]|nr:MAG: LuxR family transcriptional regulator [Smithella sp. SDB]
MIRVITVDDHAVVRRGLKQIIEEESDMQVVNEAGNGRDAISIIRRTACDVVILDISLPGMSGIEVLHYIRHEHPDLPVLIMSMHEEKQYAFRVLKAGASGYLMKDSIPEELINAIRRIIAGGRYISNSFSETMLLEQESSGKSLHEKLSDREFQIMCMIARGKALKDIGEVLCISGKTVSTYRTRILEKMKMKTNAEIVSYALKHELIT